MGAGRIGVGVTGAAGVGGLATDSTQLDFDARENNLY